MPKKTKKEKMLARYHKKLRLLENRQTVSSPIQAKIINEASMPPAESKVKTLINEPLIQELKNFNQYFFSDLKKSLLLITLIIGLEISLYFAKLIK